MDSHLNKQMSIDEINHLAIGLFNELDDIDSYNYVYVAARFNPNNINDKFINELRNSKKFEIPTEGNIQDDGYEILPDKIATGTVFKIHIEGDLKEDGYEKGLLYLTEGSSIKPHTHTNDVEQYTLQEGTLSINGISTDTNRCYIGQSHQIDPVTQNTIIKTLKISKDLILGGMPNYSDEVKKEDPTK